VGTETAVEILYTNWRGVIPQRLTYDATEWHPEPQWLMEAFDCDRKAMRSFAMKDIQQWGLNHAGSETL
jgi:predicted DNA-binding transcriptional regulator YafY